MTDRKAYIVEVLRLLRKRYGSTLKTMLEHSNPWELLVATILSAQSQDLQVNKVTKLLFKKYPSVKSYAGLRPQALYPYIGSIGIYRNKAKNIVGSAKAIVKDFNGKVPSTMAQLITLPGVGRKTANIVLSNAFGISEGIAIDTHCIVVSNRLGLAKTRNAEKIEIPHFLFLKGQACSTQQCSECLLLCPLICRMRLTALCSQSSGPRQAG